MTDDERPESVKRDQDRDQDQARGFTRRQFLQAGGAASAAVAAGAIVGEAQAAQPQSAAAASAPTTIFIPLHDGVKVAGDLYLPAQGQRFPVLFEHTPYNRTGGSSEASTAPLYTSLGYAVLIVSSRGIYGSEGNWTPYMTEGRDGYDLQEWIGQQPWCDGNIGMFGHSYPGFTQLLPAPYRSRYVKAINPSGAQSDNFFAIWSREGIYQLALGPGWGTDQQAIAEGKPAPALNWTQLLNHLPLGTLVDEINSESGIDPQFVQGTIDHYHYDEFWESMSVRGVYNQMDIPALHDTGWYDDLTRETFHNYTHMRQESRSEYARRLQYLLVGPWDHSTGVNPQRQFGDVDFGPRIYDVDVQGVRNSWYDYFLKGRRNALANVAPVTIFVMGANEWRTFSSWPLAGTRTAQLHLGSDGGANTGAGNGRLTTGRPGSEPPDRYVYDPSDPVMTNGGNGCCPIVSAPIGPYDQRSVEVREDVLVYTTGTLTRDVEVTGAGELRLFFSTNVPDTDFFVTLTDVYPDGRSIAITGGSLRTRFRNSITNPQLLTPGQVYGVTIPIWETSNVFKEGHKIRLDITSSNFPRFNRNLNSGKPQGDEAAEDMRSASQVIYHDVLRASSILLPVIAPNHRIVI